MKVIKMSSYYRDGRNVSSYRNYRKKVRPSENCVFCSGEKESLSIEGLSLTKLKIIKNDFPYDFWDMKKVEDHLMIIPRRHISCASMLKPDEFKELDAAMAYFADLGYDFFVRNSRSATKSIDHLHFHLIKTEEIKLNVEVEISN